MPILCAINAGSEGPETIAAKATQAAFGKRGQS
jgi:hypothetical protein